MFQNTLLSKYLECFPIKIVRVSCDDKPWFSPQLKSDNRKLKRIFFKEGRSNRWTNLKAEFLERCERAKKSYYTNIVSDLKESNPGQWHSKVKRMSGQNTDKVRNIMVDELRAYSDQEQADKIAEHYAKVSNQYDPVEVDDFPDCKNKQFSPPILEPWKVYQAINSMNKKAATTKGDIPIKLIIEFSVELATPMAHIYNVCLTEGIYPDIYKTEGVTPVPKVFPRKK